MGGDYLIHFFKGENDFIELVRFVSLLMGREYDSKEFTVPILVPIVRGNKQ